MREKAQRQRSDDLGLLPGSSKPFPGVAEIPDRWRVIFRVQPPNVAADYSVRGVDRYLKTFTFDISLEDDGRNGDEKSKDGVYSRTLTLPPGARMLSFMFYSGEDREFLPLPPSIFSDRILRVHGNLRTPVFRFAERFMMAELTHPNADGYTTIAKIVARKISNLPSFVRRQDGRSLGALD